MHASSNLSDLTQPPSQSAAIAFYSTAVVFNLCLVAQLLTVGVAYFYNPAGWQAHIWLVRGYSGLSLILLAWAYWQPFPRRVRTLTASLPILLGLQFLTIHLQTPLPIPLAIAHPLIGFVLFSVSTTLVHRVWQITAIAPKKSLEALSNFPSSVKEKS